VSYIAFDLDALNVCPQVGAACGLTAAEASHGLLQLWAWCFRSEQSVVTNVHLHGFFGGAEAGPALEAFGFLERFEGGWRVRGAERYLRIKEAQREGGRKGRAASSSAIGKPKRTPRQTSKSTSGSTSGSTSAPTSGSQQPLTPSTEHRAPNTESKSVAPDGARTAPDPRHAPTVKLLTTAFEAETRAKYPFTGRDAKAVTQLLAIALEPTIEATWRKALRSTGYPLVRTLPELVTHFAHFVGATGPPSAPKRLSDMPESRPEGITRL
jgi:hypothetical protein